MKKNEIRAAYKAARERYSAQSEPMLLRRAICAQLLPLLKEESGVWAAYCSRLDEADPSDAVERSPWLEWVYPRVEGENLKFYSPSSMDDFEKGKWQINEPIVEKSKEVKISQISGFLIPGVAFDRQGHRLGQGKGYYDRVLEGSKAKKIGIAFKTQIAEEALPVEAHDIRMDTVVTDEFVVRP